MNEKKLYRILSSLIEKSRNYQEEKTFFLPNQSRSWLDFVVRRYSPLNQSSVKILIVGGLFYSCYLSAKGYQVTVIEKSPLAAISQIYACWLMEEKNSLFELQRLFLLYLVGNRKKPHKRTGVLIPDKDYSLATKKFIEFTKIKDQMLSQEIFDNIFKIETVGKKKIFSLIKKGVNLLGFESAKFQLPRKIIISDIKQYAQTASEKFDVIISSNVINFFSNPEEFLFVFNPLLKKQGLMEITVYDQPLQKILGEMFGVQPQSLVVGQAQLLKKVKPNHFLEFISQLKLNQHVFLLTKEMLNQSVNQKMPYWIKELLAKGRFKTNYQLSKPDSWYFVMDKKKLKEVKIREQ